MRTQGRISYACGLCVTGLWKALPNFDLMRRLKTGLLLRGPTGLKAGLFFLKPEKGCGAQWCKSVCTQTTITTRGSLLSSSPWVLVRDSYLNTRTPLQCPGVGGVPRAGGAHRSATTYEVMLTAVLADRDLPGPPANVVAGWKHVRRVVLPNNEEVRTVLVSCSYQHPTPAEVLGDDIPRKPPRPAQHSSCRGEPCIAWARSTSHRSRAVATGAGVLPVAVGGILAAESPH